MNSLLRRSCLTLAAILVVSCSASDSSDYNTWGNGQPGCQTEEELRVQLYRNFYDPNHYWVCKELGQPAEAVRCEDGTVFLDSAKACVPWAQWKWEVPIKPLSKPAKIVAETTTPVIEE